MDNIYNVGVCGLNSYLVVDEKTVLIDTVSKKYSVEFLENIKKYTDRVDYLVFNRTTPDAVGCVVGILRQYPEVKIIASVAGLRNLKEIINAPFKEIVAKNDKELCIGKSGIRFVMAPNLSWPDTMMTYMCDKKVLFSGNLFCRNAENEFFSEASLKTALENVTVLSPDVILPAYGEFSNQTEIPENGNSLGIIYASSGGNTEEMAFVIEAAAKNAGKEVVVCKAQDVSAEFFNRCDCFAIGTPTINHNADASVIALLSGINVVRNMGKSALVFGSYGWSGEGVEIVAGLLRNLKIKVYKKPFKSIFNLSDMAKDELYNFALEFIGEIKNA